MIVCRKCLTAKEDTNFRINRKDCKPCEVKITIELERTKNGLASKLYREQRYRSKQRGHKDPEYTKEEFKNWLFTQENFNELYLKWVLSGYVKGLKPSVDRLDDYKGYSFDNIQLVTWYENNQKGYRDRIEGINNKKSNAVVQRDLKGNIIKRYYSIAQAARDTNINFRNIHKVAKLQRKTAGGFVWEYDTRRS